LPGVGTESYKDLKDLSREELEEFVQEKEQIRKIVGQIGGRPTTLGKVVNWGMLFVILLTLVAAPFIPKELELPAIEIGLILISIKIFIFLHNEAKVIHFQFWMLSSLEWRMNEISKRLSQIDKNIQTSIDDDGKV